MSRQSRVVDAHAHVFEASTLVQPRPVTQLYPADRRAPAEDLLKDMDALGIDHAVLVGLHVGDHYIAESARKHPSRFAAVGVYDPAIDDSRSEAFSALRHRRLRGLRMRSLGDPSVSNVRRLDPFPLLAFMEEERRVVSFFGEGTQMDLLLEILQLLPQLTVVLNHLGVPLENFSVDHLGRPRLNVPLPPPTLTTVAALSEFPNVHVVWSGQYAVSRSVPPFADTIAWSERLVELYGPNRMLWGSDYPWIIPQPGYKIVLDLVDAHFPGLPTDQREAIMGNNAARLYGFVGR
jgi:L-fuconolactonase